MPRKKKTEAEVFHEEVIMKEEYYDLDMNNQKKIWPKVNKGSHLTVYTYEDGSTKLEWDDEALTRDVKDAILKYESHISVTSTKKVKNERIKKN